MLKRIIALLLSTSVIICLCACKEETNSKNNSSFKATTTTSSDEKSTLETHNSNENDNPEDFNITPDVDIENNVNVDNNTYNNDNNKNTAPAYTPQQTTVYNNSTSHRHSYSKATCTSPKRCSCGQTSGSALGHSYSSATCSSPKICNRCGSTSGSALGHSYSSATCTSPKNCSRCGTTSGSALGHNYKNNKCTRCGITDPATLPTPLNNLHVIDSYHYKYKSGSFTDSYGNNYDGVHFYNSLHGKAYSIFNLNQQYKTFSGSIVAATTTDSGFDYYINIYVDDVLKFSKTNFTKTTSKVDFRINVSGGQVVKITMGQDGMGSPHQELGIVNAVLEK